MDFPWILPMSYFYEALHRKIFQLFSRKTITMMQEQLSTVCYASTKRFYLLRFHKAQTFLIYKYVNIYQ